MSIFKILNLTRLQNVAMQLNRQNQASKRTTVELFFTLLDFKETNISNTSGFQED
jgi:hypothetical protein